MTKAPPDPAVTLANAVSSLRTVGTVLALLGLFVCFDSFVMQISLKDPFLLIGMMVSNSIFLLIPGVLYHVTAVMIRQHQVTVALIARRTAFVQSTMSLCCVAVNILISEYGGARTEQLVIPLFIPAIMTAFFAPALIAQAVQIGKALAALTLLSESRRGFEVLAVLPVVDDDEAPDEFDGLKGRADDAQF